MDIRLLDYPVVIEIVPIKYTDMHQINIFCYLHVEDEFHFRIGVRAVDLEETMDELLEVHIPVLFQIQYGEKAFSDDARELGVLYARKEN